MKECNQCKVKMFDGAKGCGICGSNDVTQLTPIIEKIDHIERRKKAMGGEPVNDEWLKDKPEYNCKHGAHSIRLTQELNDVIAYCELCNEHLQRGRI